MTVPAALMEDLCAENAFTQEGPAEEDVTLMEALSQAAMLLGGVPALTVLTVTAARYVAGGSF